MSEKPVRVLVADDQQLVRAGFKLIIEGEPENRQMIDRLLAERREISELIFDLRDDG